MQGKCRPRPNRFAVFRQDAPANNLGSINGTWLSDSNPDRFDLGPNLAPQGRYLMRQNWSGREMLKIFGLKLPALFVALAFSTPSIASSCNHEIVVPIKFPPGKLEWAFRGRGTHFFGFFQKGQSLNIAGAGGIHDFSGDFSWASSSTDPWQITIEGPNGFIQVTDVETEGVLYVEKLPATGKYVISIGPCADWGESGTLIIHASDPRLTID
jgi:hypothetical protein